MLQTDFPCSYDLPHFGTMFRHIRETLGLKQSKIADHIVADVATVNRFEKLGTTHPDTVANIVDSLSDPKLARGLIRHPLTKDNIELLHSIYADFRQRHEQEIALASVDFELVTSGYCPSGLRNLVQKMRTCGYPAFLIDPLWFIHAINGAGLQVFGLDPKAEYMNHWEFWHVLGTKFAKDSPVRGAHASIDDYFPPSVDVFFKLTSPYLFTIQMRSLLCRLHQMSDENSYEFTRSWQSAYTFNLPYRRDPRSRKLLYNEQVLNVISEYDPEEPVNFSKGIEIPFMLGFWKPVEPESRTQLILEEIWASPNGSNVFFAADYDHDKTFHANSWPNVVAEIEERLESL